MKKILILFLSLVFILSCGKKQEKEVRTKDVKEYRWKLATTWSSTLPLLSEPAKNLSKFVNEMSNGQLQIEIVPSNIHKSPLGIFDFVKTNQYQMGHTTSYYWKGKDFNTIFFTTIPFLFITPEIYAWFYEGGGMEFMQEVYNKYDMYAFPGGNTALQMGGWFRKPIKSISDFKGLKIRIPGFAGEVLTKVGASTVNIPPGELYTSLERGNLDALEWVGPSLDLDMGFPKIAKYYYTGWHEPGAEAQFLVNKSEFDVLPENLQTILVTAMKVSAYQMYYAAYDLNARKLDDMKEKYPDIEVVDFSPEILDKLREITFSLLEEEAQKDQMTKKILKSQLDYFEKVRNWTKISDYYYLKNVEK